MRGAMFREAWILGAAALIGLAACHGSSPPAPPRAASSPVVAHDASSIRRVCRQMGLGSPDTGGGSIVFVTGVHDGDLTIDTLRGERVSAAGAQALCMVPEQRMRVCPGDAQRSAEVPVEDSLRSGVAKSTATISRGEPIAFYEYISSASGETKAIVNIGGKARFIPADDVCHLETPLPTSRATDAFKMIQSVYGGPHAFRPRAPEAIKRIVIHNTEVPLRETLNHFGRLEANTSAHIVIDRDGTTYRVVEDQFAAFHAGASKDALGGYNSTSLGIEVVAYDNPAKYGGAPHANAGFTEAQRQAVIRLVDFWMSEYKLEIDPEVMQNRSTATGYTDLEYRQAAVTIHRLTKADRGTDCPRLLFPNSPDGDESFFRWREQTFSKAARRARGAP